MKRRGWVSTIGMVCFVVFGAAACGSDSGDLADTGTATPDAGVAADLGSGADVIADATPIEDASLVDDVPAPDDVPAVEEDVPPAADAAPETVEPTLLETRLDPICVGELCAAGPENAPDPGEMGPFPVGVRTFVFIDENPAHDQDGPRHLRTEIWYPTTEEHRDGPFVVYDLAQDSPPEMAHIFEEVAHIEGLPTLAVRDAPLREADGPYPLVFFSHGAYGVRFQSAFQTVHMASHGYIVVSPDHQNNTTWDYLDTGYDGAEVVMSALERVRDGEFLVDKLFEMANDPETMFHDHVATQRVGFTGHSFGGFLSLVQGGLDERISVIVPISPAGTAAGLIAGVNLGTYRIPLLYIGGDADETLQFDIEMWQPYLRTAPPKAFLRFYRGGHYTFTDMCSVDVAALATDLGWGDAEDALTDGCGEENFEPAMARALTNHFATAMFNLHLRRSPASRAFLSADHLADFEGEVEFFDELD